MAYRTAGYPARYVEGYHLSSTEAESLADKKTKNITLTTQNAHAWAEVYVAGVGWLPVEVVPGLYTETYTNETVEGKPVYKINPQSNQDGMDTGDNAKGSGNSSSVSKKKKRKLHQKVLSMIFVYFLFLWTLCTMIYLLLELQRYIRMNIHKNKKQTAISEKKIVSFYIKEIESILIAGRVKGNFSHPLELWNQIGTNFPEIKEEEYKRMLALVQKARFGGMYLKPYEIYTLECFVQHLKEALYQKQNFIGKIRLRYIHII